MPVPRGSLAMPPRPILQGGNQWQDLEERRGSTERRSSSGWDELERKLARLDDRDLNPRARARIEGEIKREMRALRDDLAEKTRGLIRGGEVEAAKVTPAARSRKAILQDPARFAGFVAAFGQVQPSELLAFALEARASGDYAAQAALGVSLSQRDDVEREVAEKLQEVLNRDGEELGRKLAEVAVARSEAAALAVAFASSSAGSAREVKAALSLAHEAKAVEVDGQVRALTDDDLTAAYTRLGIERATEMRPDEPKVPGTWVGSQPAA